LDTTGLIKKGAKITSQVTTASLLMQAKRSMLPRVSFLAADYADERRFGAAFIRVHLRLDTVQIIFESVSQ